MDPSVCQGPPCPRSVTLIEMLSACQNAAERIASYLLRNEFGSWDPKGPHSARLACKELRRAVDDHVPKLELTVRPTDRQRWAVGQLPSLTRFTACRAVRIRIVPNSGADSIIVALPFLGLELSARQRIEELVLEVANPASNCFGEAAAVMLASKLPNLQKLDLSRVPMSYDTVQQLLMYEALSALPYLSQLSLPKVRALDWVGTLATSNHLTAITVGWGFNSVISEQAVEGISRLQSLKSLLMRGAFRLTADDHAAADTTRLQQLLTSLPVSMDSLSFGVHMIASGLRSELEMFGGRLRAVNISSKGTICLPAEATTFIDLLDLLSGQGPSWLSTKPHFRLKGINIKLEEPLSGFLRERLLVCIQGCDEVDIRYLTAPMNLAVEAVRLVGVPRFLTVADNSIVLGPFSPVTRETRHEQQAAQLQHNHHRHPQHHPVPLPVLSAAQLSQMVMRVLCYPSVDKETLLDMIRACHSTSATANAGGSSIGSHVAAATAATDASNPEPHPHQQPAEDTDDTDDELPPPELLLLHGQFISLLAATSKASLASWLRGLRDGVAQAAGLEDAGGKLLKSYLVLPTDMSAVLVECGEAVGASEAVVNAVRSLAVGRAADGLLQVAPVALEHLRHDYDDDDMEEVQWMKVAYGDALDKVVQTSWEYFTTGLEDDPDRQREVLVRLLEMVTPLLRGELDAAEL